MCGTNEFWNGRNYTQQLFAPLILMPKLKQDHNCGMMRARLPPPAWAKKLLVPSHLLAAPIIGQFSHSPGFYPDNPLKTFPDLTALKSLICFTTFILYVCAQRAILTILRQKVVIMPTVVCCVRWRRRHGAADIVQELWFFDGIFSPRPGPLDYVYRQCLAITNLFLVDPSI